MPISQCPKCVLKFSSRSEMQWHFREDHPKPLPLAATRATRDDDSGVAARAGARRGLQTELVGAHLEGGLVISVRATSSTPKWRHGTTGPAADTCATSRPRAATCCGTGAPR